MQANILKASCAVALLSLATATQPRRLVPVAEATSARSIAPLPANSQNHSHPVVPSGAEHLEARPAGVPKFAQVVLRGRGTSRGDGRLGRTDRDDGDQDDPNDDGYADTNSSHPRASLPNDPEGDHHGGGPNAPSRLTSPTGEMPDHFSLLRLIFGECQPESCEAWDRHCTIQFVIAALLMFWTFKNLKVVSDLYFVPSTIIIARRLNMAPDVAGATLLAFGSSAPEFCTNVVATFFIVNECGVGDIIGSAIHNILLVVGVSGIFAIHSLNLWWYPLSRDCLFYFVSVAELLVFLIDEHIVVWEASVMVATYGAYCVWMFWNQPIYTQICSLCKLEAVVPEDQDSDDEPEEGILYYDPVEIIWRNCMPSSETHPVACFLSALLNIGWLSYIMVDSATRFGCIAGIPTLFMGLVFLAAGTSIPDAFASIGAAKRGEGDMAVSNALGSNIFDILLGLGMPWLISLLMGQPIVFLGVSRLLYWVVALLVILFLFMGIIVGSGWKLNQKTGILLGFFYIGYVVYAFLKSLSIVP